MWETIAKVQGGDTKCLWLSAALRTPQRKVQRGNTKCLIQGV